MPESLRIRFTPPFLDLLIVVLPDLVFLANGWPEKEIGLEGSLTGPAFVGFLASMNILFEVQSKHILQKRGGKLPRLLPQIILIRSMQCNIVGMRTNCYCCQCIASATATAVIQHTVAARKRST